MQMMVCMRNIRTYRPNTNNGNIHFPFSCPLPQIFGRSRVSGTASSQSISVKNMKHVVFSVKRIIVSALSCGERALYFAKPGWLR